ncbi:MAG: glycosyltransferase [Sulfitobacter sp.]
MTQVVSIFERIGLGGGGKVKAVLHRMNALSEMAEFDAILLNLDHSPSQKLNFAELQANGTIARKVRMLTLPEACHTAARKAGVQPFTGFPEFDRIKTKGSKTTYFKNDTPVMVDRTRQTPIGTVTRRNVPDDGHDLNYTLIDGAVSQLVLHNADGTTETTDFVNALPIRWTKSRGREFVIGKNLITDTICRMHRIHRQNLFEMIALENSVVFFDGVTSAYLASVTKGPRALFLHADHRSPAGKIVPRSKFLIENFKGEAIITSTNVHKAQIEADVIPAADVHVIPHFYESGQPSGVERKHLVTVSRLELTGKPIHDCIEAFCLIKGDFPEVDYLIYGVGAGQQQLSDQIARLACEDRVTLAGYTKKPLAVFQNALASVYPTTTEGFGLSILEALANGCPVISNDVNYGPREMITPGKNGELVPLGNIKELAEAMRRVLLEPNHYHHGTSIGLDRYTRQAYLSNYRNIVHKLVVGGVAETD